MKTYKDVYKLPLHFGHAGQYRSTWVYDQNYNFVFQFERKYTDRGMHDEKWLEFERRIMSRINDEDNTPSKMKWSHKNGYIICSNEDHEEQDGLKVILIRGWGNLTGVGGMNLSGEEAVNIQDTFADFIVEQLNKRE